MKGDSQFMIPEANSSPFYIRAILFVWGALCFSPIISFIFIRILGAPLVVSEIPMLFFFCFFRKKLGLQLRFPMIVVVSAILLLLAVGLGFLYGEYSKIAILSNARTYVVILFWMACFAGNHKITLEYILYLALGSVAGWLAISYLNFNSVVFGGDEGSGATSGAMLALSILLSVSYLYKRRRIFWLSSGLVLGTCFFSGTRRAMLSGAWAMLASLFVEFRVKRLFVATMTGVFLGGLLFLVWTPLGEWVKSESPYMYVRIFSKTETLLKEGTEAENDLGRFAAIENLITPSCLKENVLPRGMVSKWTTREEGTGIFMDCPVYELYHTFGFLGAFLLFAVVLFRVLKHLRLFWKKKQRSSAVFAILGMHMLLMMFYEGGFISFAPFSIFTAFAIVNLFSNKEVLYSARYGSQTNKQIVQVK